MRKKGLEKKVVTLIMAIALTVGSVVVPSRTQQQVKAATSSKVDWYLVSVQEPVKLSASKATIAVKQSKRLVLKNNDQNWSIERIVVSDTTILGAKLEEKKKAVCVEGLAQGTATVKAYLSRTTKKGVKKTKIEKCFLTVKDVTVKNETVTVGKKKKLKLQNNLLGWKITKVKINDPNKVRLVKQAKEYFEVEGLKSAEEVKISLRLTHGKDTKELKVSVAVS